MSATLRLHRGQTSLAIQDLNHAVESATDDDQRSEALYELGTLYAAQGERERALAAFEGVHEGFRDREDRLKGLREQS